MLPAPAKALTALFQDGELDLELDPAIERTGRAFFDQVLLLTLVLRLPVAPKLLPPPPTASEAPAFLLPIRTPFPGSSPDAFSREHSAVFPQSEYEHDHLDDDDGGHGDGTNTGSGGSRPSVPRLLRTLLALIRVQVEGSYSSTRAAVARSLPSSSVPVPSMRRVDRELFTSHKSSQKDDADPTMDSRASAMVPFHSQTWAGNKNGRTSMSSEAGTVPTGSQLAQASSSKAQMGSCSKREQRGQITFEPGAGGNVAAGRWVVRWSCEVPVSFMQLPTMSPSLALTATLSLLLSSTQLALLFDLPAPAELFGGDQDLLSALSEGPVYPGESPSDRAQRTKSSLARLPLSQLSAQVIGTKLLTPESAANEIKHRTQRSATLPPPPDSAAEDIDDAFDGDLASASAIGKAPSASASLTRSRAPPQLNSTTTDPSATAASEAFSRERRVLRRSCLRVLDVSSAVSVRLRTVLSPARPTLQPPPLQTSLMTPSVDQNDDEGALEPFVDGIGVTDSSTDALEQYPVDEGGALLLCVELDHPLLPLQARQDRRSESGELSFEISNVKIDVLEPSALVSGDGDAQGSVVQPIKPAVNESLRATLFDPEQDRYRGEGAGASSTSTSVFPFVLTQGQQRNLVYCVDFLDPAPPEVPDSRPGSMTMRPVPSLLSGSDAGQVRQVNIVVEARPLLRSNSDDPTTRVREAEATGADRETKSLPSFSSAWNCTVDVGTARTSLVRRYEAQRTREHHERVAVQERVPVAVAMSA